MENKYQKKALKAVEAFIEETAEYWVKLKVSPEIIAGITTLGIRAALREIGQLPQHNKWLDIK